MPPVSDLPCYGLFTKQPAQDFKEWARLKLCVHVSNEKNLPLYYSEFSTGRDVDSIYASDHCAKNQRDYSESQVVPRHQILFSFPSA
jgi:hypothetical protein